MAERSRKIKEFLIKNFCIFKTVTLVLGMVLLVSDIILFFVEKPNISVVKYSKQTNQNFPQILLYKAPSDENIARMKEVGFDSFSHFIFGIVNYDVSYNISFGGKTKMDPKLIVKHHLELSDLISKILVTFVEDNAMEYIIGTELKTNIKISVQGFCYSLDLSNKFTKTIRNIRIYLNDTTMVTQGIPYINVYLTPTPSNVDLYTKPFNMRGDKLRDTGENTIAQYQIQVCY